MSVLPLRSVNLTAATLDMVGVFAAIYADIVANSTWTATHQTTTIPAGALGAFSMTLRSPSGAVEINLINGGTALSPSATVAKLGINPDGSADPSTLSNDPQASALNFSGVDNGWALTQTIQHAEFILVEWDDSLMVLFKNNIRTTFPNGWHLGKIWQQPIPKLENTGDLRLDGHVVMGNVPAVASGTAWVSNNASGGSLFRRRISVGNTINTTISGKGGAWAQPVSGQSLTSYPLSVNDATYIYAGTQRIVVPVEYHQVNANSADKGWLAKYLRLTSPILQPYALWRVSSVDQYLVIGNTTAVSPLCIPILPGFDPTP